MPAIKIGDGTIWYARQGREHTRFPPIVLVHGAGGSHLDWPAQLRRLPDARVYALDLPGHGRSTLPGRMAIADYARDVVALCDALGLPSVVVIGHSMGAGIALTLALDWPERVAGLVLLGGGAKLRVHPDILEKIQTDPPAVYRLLRDWMWGPDAPDALREMTFQQMLKGDPGVTHGDYVACNRFDVLDRLEEIAAPALVIGGTDDRMTPLKFSRTLAERMPAAELVTVEGAGHMLALEQPDVVQNAIVGWLNRVMTGDSV
ncbi:MAG: alpha/beta hydrolase [Anaerolineae bacterium]